MLCFGKRLFLLGLLCVLLGVGNSVQASNLPNELILRGSPIQVLDNTSINTASEVFRGLEDIEFVDNPGGVYGKAWFTLGEIEIDNVRTGREIGSVKRLITIAHNVSSNRGIKVGDSVVQMKAAYGNPRVKINNTDARYSAAVAYWVEYAWPDDPRFRVVFGIDYDNNVYCLGARIRV